MPSSFADLRSDFPALERYVYLNAAAGSPTPRPVREAVSAFLRDYEEGGDHHWNAWIDRREEIRARVASLVNAEPGEIAFVPNTSTGINFIADLLASEGPMLTDELEFPTVTLPWIHRGTQVHFVPAVEGIPRIESFSAADAPRAATIAISHVQFSNGCRLDLESFGASKSGRRLVVSGSQSVGAFPVDVKVSHVDALATTGHKWLCAGYGAGFLYVARELLDRHPPRTLGWLSVENPFVFDNARYTVLPDARRVEMGCPSFAGIFALGAAVEYLMGIGIEAIAERVLTLNVYLTMRLERDGFTVLSPAGDSRSGITLVELPEPGRAAAFLRHRGVLVTQKPEGVRISTHFYNDESDVDACIEGLLEYRRGLVSGP
ncbi:MAG: aminotransferase class V-fold PLP-dependent enzyme [Acidobacteria bacterium]|nr:aminotransferase class V-fold PLP-dependent enzyme [Acidobacteriota bacterium]